MECRSTFLSTNRTTINSKWWRQLVAVIVQWGGVSGYDASVFVLAQRVLVKGGHAKAQLQVPCERPLSAIVTALRGEAAATIKAVNSPWNTVQL